MGTFDDEGTYTPRQVVDNDTNFSEAVTGIPEVDDGQLVSGIVVKIDRDEVLLDIGYKSEGVIPSRELSIRNDVNPAEVVSMGESIEALVLTKEDKEVVWFCRRSVLNTSGLGATSKPRKKQRLSLKALSSRS